MAKKIKKTLGTVGKLFSIIPDTTEIIGKTIDNTRPIIEKHMEQKHEKEMQLTLLDDVINLPVDKAQKHLEQLGFVVALLPVKPNKKWIHASLNEVVSMSPKPGKHKLGSLVKLYYVTVDVLEKSQAILDQETLKAVERNQKIADTIEAVKQIKFPFRKK
ncbi:TPA: PASTA domain-containing protein [Streptococcus equi subsp. zooepidemicus]|nr:PASTA domain-containing protein [Streptococcus equi]MDI6035561.1 PASTA domain-containing protein [Streptococcus equi subsp. zooepidemicus]QZA21861.1 PASTA domain-containing protein [Streptococcus equi subsp. zooepidemicus]SQF54040.1 PnkB-like serine/threonine kinase protein [Streptococcus equi subsp. zooepidemicus]HEK9097220.1 PASTA domain-containing protein [Streptococcus equi subsp. zooepidemicus]HEL0096054.1 PASTA domain-containing protein [Streptococcus equi subsp. zooepidemicus]